MLFQARMLTEEPCQSKRWAALPGGCFSGQDVETRRKDLTEISNLMNKCIKFSSLYNYTAYIWEGFNKTCCGGGGETLNVHNLSVKSAAVFSFHEIFLFIL